MRRALLTLVVMMFTSTMTMAQSPADEGAQYAKRIVNHVVKGNYDAITDECLALYSYAMELSLEEQEAFVDGFNDSLYDSSIDNGLGEEFVDALILHFEDIVNHITEYKGGDEDDEAGDDEVDSTDFEY